MSSIESPARRSLRLALLSEEPFRIFFPLGLAAGIVGLALWPLFFAGATKIYPSLIHARVMVEGFLGSFIVGFLGTAGPRLLDAPRLSPRESAALVLLLLSTVAAHLAAWISVGDAFFLVLLLVLLTALGRRLATAQELPPPNFLLVACGLLSGIAGATLALMGNHFSLGQLYLFGNLLLNEAFALLPVLGIGVFLFPRFLGEPSGLDQVEGHTPARHWKRKALFAGMIALGIIVSFAVECYGHQRVAGGLRFTLAVLYLGVTVPAVLRLGRAPFLGQCARIATWLLLLGLLWPVILPGYRVAGLHLLFIGGFMLAIFTVGARVVLGHSGQSQRFQGRMPFLLTTAILLLVGMATRIGADFMPTPRGRDVHLIYAALLCIAAALVWGIRLLPSVLVPDTDE